MRRPVDGLACGGNGGGAARCAWHYWPWCFWARAMRSLPSRVIFSFSIHVTLSQLGFLHAGSAWRCYAMYSARPSVYTMLLCPGDEMPCWRSVVNIGFVSYFFHDPNGLSASATPMP